MSLKDLNEKDAITNTNDSQEDDLPALDLPPSMKFILLVISVIISLFLSPSVYNFLLNILGIGGDSFTPSNFLLILNWVVFVNVAWIFYYSVGSIMSHSNLSDDQD